MANKTTLEEVKEILDRPILGHPSRNLEQQINNLKDAVLVLAKEASIYRGI